MKALVFGQSGQVAQELARLLPNGTFLGRSSFDLNQPDNLQSEITTRQPEFVINAAAYTAVDKAEDDVDAAMALNATAPALMAKTCASLGIPFVHISTDYVFGGSGETPRKPDDPTGPLGVYGRTKLLGEQQIAQAGGIYAVLRTSWVFSSYGNNFLKTMLRLSEAHNRLTIVGDQIGGPTPANAIAAACIEMAKQLKEDATKSGVYHFAGAPETSWAGFANEIFAQAGRDVEIAPIPTSDYPTRAARPLNSRLDCSSLQAVFGISQPRWTAGIEAALKELKI